MHIVVPGNPIAWARPGRRNNRYFTPLAQSAQMESVRAAWATAGSRAFEGPVELHLTFDMKRPESHWGQGRNNYRVRPSAPRSHLGRPDVDNLAKLVLDALEGYAWQNDSQVIRIVCHKQYGEPPRTTILACPVPNEEAI